MGNTKKPRNKKKQDICDFCKKQEGKWKIDPYEYELYGIKKWTYICDDCYHKRMEEI